MKLYKLVLIESAEQAEALPIGTVATHSSGAGMDHAHKPGPPPGHAESLLWISLCGLVSNPGMVGWTALVPIEAEEEIERRIPFDGRSGEDLPPSKGGRYRRTVYTTPWEEA